MNLIKKLIYVFVGLTLVCLIFLQKQRITVAFEGTRKVLDFKNYVQLLQTTNNLFYYSQKQLFNLSLIKFRVFLKD